MGNIFCVFHGPCVPIVLRKKSRHYVAVGEACKSRFPDLYETKYAHYLPLDVHDLMGDEVIHLVES